MIEGFLEALRPFQVRGWAIDRDDPATPVAVRASIGGRVVASGSANLFRHDLAAALQSDGKQGFILNVAEPLPLQNPASIIVEALPRSAPPHTLSPASSMVIERANIQQRESGSESSVKGYLEIEPFKVGGWAFDSSDPDRHLFVEIEVDGQAAGRVCADQFRADLVVAGVGSGDHGFSFGVDERRGPLSPRRVDAHALTASGSRVKLTLATGSEQPAEANAGDDLIFPGDLVDDLSRPVIVLGAARSGTSAMAQALTGCGAFAGCEEGHFLDILTPLLQAADQFYRNRAEEAQRATHLAQIPKSFVDQGLRHLVLQAARQAFPAGRWVDKTPRATMVAVSPLLHQIWPNARFVYMRRRAIENLDSRLRKFTRLDFAAHCREWALSIRNWNAVVPMLKGAAVEIDQNYMATHPAEVTAALARLLDLDNEQIARVAQALAFDQPERTAGQFGVTTTMSDLGWPDHYIETFQQICGPVLAEAGYGSNDDYFLDNVEAYGLVVR